MAELEGPEYATVCGAKWDATGARVSGAAEWFREEQGVMRIHARARGDRNVRCSSAKDRGPGWA